MVNYFELYGIPQSFAPAEQQVKAKYYELSRKYHPDRFAQADEATRAEALRMAALNNDAYKTLSNADAAMAYILKLYGLQEDEEKYNLPPAFLMEMMELNETVSEYEMDPENTSLKDQVTSALAEQLEQWHTEVSPLVKKFDENGSDKTLLLRIKDYYFRKKYLLRIQERINTFASR